MYCRTQSSNDLLIMLSGTYNNAEQAHLPSLQNKSRWHKERVLEREFIIGTRASVTKIVKLVTVSTATMTKVTTAFSYIGKKSVMETVVKSRHSV